MLKIKLASRGIILSGKPAQVFQEVDLLVKCAGQRTLGEFGKLEGKGERHDRFNIRTSG